MVATKKLSLAHEALASQMIIHSYYMDTMDWQVRINPITGRKKACLMIILAHAEQRLNRRYLKGI